MALLAYNKTLAPLALAAGSPIVTLPASTTLGVRGFPFNVTTELKGLSNANYALLQAQVIAGGVDFQWTSTPEYVTFGLNVGELENVYNDIVYYVSSTGTGNDAADGITAATPLATLTEAFNRLPTTHKKASHIILAASGVNYDLPKARYFIPKPIGPLATPFTIIAPANNVLGNLTATASGTNTVSVTLGSAVVDAYRGNFLNVISGALAGRRVTVTANSVPVVGIVTFTVNDSIASAILAGDTIAIESPAATINVTGGSGTLAFAGAQLGMKNCKMLLNGNLMALDECRWSSTEGCEFRNGSITVAHVSFMDIQSFRFLYLNDPAQPFDQNTRGCAGAYLNGISLTVDTTSSVGMAGAMDSCTVSVKGESNFYIAQGALSTRLTSFIAASGSFLELNSSPHGAIDSSPANGILISDHSILHLNDVEVNSSTLSGLLLSQNSFATVTKLTGVSNTRYGVECLDRPLGKIGDLLSSVTGTLGNIKVGSLPVRSWSNFNAGSDNLPIQNEFDVDGDGSRLYGPTPGSAVLGRFAVYSNVGRPLATAVLAGSIIFNSDDNAPNISDGTNWRDMAGNIT